MFTYLHVSDSYRSTGRVLEVISPTRAAENVTPERRTVCNHNRFKSSSLLKLKEPITYKKENQRRNSLLGTVRSERSGKHSSIFRRRCNTWPEGEKRVKESQSNSKLQVFIKKQVIDNKSNSFPEDNLPNAVKTSGEPVKNICSYLSLGSTLSFSLPKCFHNSVLDMENKEEIQPVQIYDDSSNQKIPSARTPQSEMEVKSVIHTKQSEINLHTVDMEDFDSTEEPTTEVETQQLNHVNESTEAVLRVFTPVEYEEPDNVSSSHHEASSPAVNGSVTHCGTLCPSSSGGHNCLSVYTKIKDLNGHLYYTSKCLKIKPSKKLFPNGPGSCNSGRVINCGVRDCAVCFSDTVKETSVDWAEKPDISMEELLKPGHWSFQQEEEELEDIWRGRVGNLTSNCTVEINTDEGSRRLSQ